NIIFDGHALANERMAGNLAVGTDRCILLDFDKCADLRVVSYRASIKINEFGKLDVLSKFDVGTDREKIFIHRIFKLEMNSAAADSKPFNKFVKTGAADLQFRGCTGQISLVAGKSRLNHLPFYNFPRLAQSLSRKVMNRAIKAEIFRCDFSILRHDG